MTHSQYENVGKEKNNPDVLQRQMKAPCQELY